MAKNNSNQNAKFTPYISSDKPQMEITIRAVILGMLISAIFGLGNAYIGLKYGMTISASLPAAVISMAVQNKDLHWVGEMGAKVSKVAVYGIVTGMTQQVITEFDDDLIKRYNPSELQSALEADSLYQKVLPLDSSKRYKLSLVIEDLNDKNIGVIRQAVIPPSFDEEALASSTLIMSDSYELDSTAAMADRMFVIGNVWIHPSLDKTFTSEKSLGAFFHVYNAALDQTTYAPSIQAKYEVLKEGKTVLRLVEHNHESLQYYSEKALVFVKQLPVQRLGPGKYNLQIEVRDHIKNEAITLQDHFEIEDSKKLAAQTVRGYGN